MESNNNSAFVRNKKTNAAPIKENSLSNFLSKTKKEESSVSGMMPLSLFTNPAKTPVLKHHETSQSDLISLIKTPSMYKQESQSELVHNDTPMVSLPNDTPAMAHDKGSTPGGGLLGMFDTPVISKNDKKKPIIKTDSMPNP